MAANQNSVLPPPILLNTNVRQLINKFQQLQQERQNARGLLSPRRYSSKPQRSTHREHSIINLSQNGEIEPSSLPLAERVRFFSNLSTTSNSGSSPGCNHNTRKRKWTQNSSPTSNNPTSIEHNAVCTQSHVLSVAQMNQVNAAPYFKLAKRSLLSNASPTSTSSLNSVAMSPASETAEEVLPLQTRLNNKRRGGACEEPPTKKIGRIKSVFLEKQLNTEVYTIGVSRMPLRRQNTCAECRQEYNDSSNKHNHNISHELTYSCSVSQMCQKLTHIMGGGKVTPRTWRPGGSPSDIAHFYSNVPPKYTPVKKYEDIPMTKSMLQEACQRFEDIAVEPEELQQAPEEFERLFSH